MAADIHLVLIARRCKKNLFIVDHFAGKKGVEILWNRHHTHIGAVGALGGCMKVLVRWLTAAEGGREVSLPSSDYMGHLHYDTPENGFPVETELLDGELEFGSKYFQIRRVAGRGTWRKRNLPSGTPFVFLEGPRGVGYGEVIDEADQGQLE